MASTTNPSASVRAALGDDRPKKKRKSRPQLSCNECRRLKLKCDRRQPCGTCIRRECADICRQNEPAEVQSSEQCSNKTEDEVARLQQRLALLEDSIRRKELRVPSSSKNLTANMDRHSSPPLQGDYEYASTDLGESNNDLASSHGHHVQSAFAQYPPPTNHLTFTDEQSQMPVSTDHVANQMTPAHPFDYNDPPLNPVSFDQAAQTISSASPVYPSGNRPNIPASHVGAGYQYDHNALLPAGRSITFDNHNLESTEEGHGHGTLVISRSGRSKYLGRTAAAEWLKNQETVESGDSPPPTSQLPSPRMGAQVIPHHGGGGFADALGAVVAFPFNTASKSISTLTILSVLPPQHDARVLIDTYFRHFSWHFNIASRSLVDSIFEKAYTGSNSTGAQRRGLTSQQLALLFVIFAVGSYYNLELTPDDSSVEDYIRISQACLAKGDFLANNTTAGVQTLHIMAHLLLSMDSGKNGDSAWPLWGLTAHMSLAMGLHRDGARWNLPEHAIEERRRVFWECHSTEIMSCNCFSRPGIINPDHVDTAYPKITPGDIEPFHRYKYELSHLFAAVLDHSSRVRTPPYSTCLDLYEKACAFERKVPYELRCRPVLCALPSAYPAPESAIAASPPTDKRNLHLTFQQFTLAMNISELIVFLNRPYFAQALHDSPRDPTRSKYGQSYLAVVERCNAIVVIATRAHALYPHAAARHWWIWYHAFSSAICMGTLVLKNPQNVLCGFAITLIDNVVSVYQSVVGSRNSPRMVKNLHWLRRLRHKLGVKLAQSPDQSASTSANAMDAANSDADEELLGWRTRLISAAGQGLQISRTIRANSVSTASPNQQENQDILAVNPGSSAGNLLHRQDPMDPTLPGSAWETEFNQFWESMVHNDGLNMSADAGSFNWWGLDALADIGSGISQEDQSSVSVP